MADSSAEGRWEKSTYSAEEDCLEWRIDETGVRLRNSRDPDGPQLHLSATEWRAFLNGVRRGEADI